MFETEDGRRVQRDRGAAAREAAQKKAEAEFLANERAKKARYENITFVLDLGKVEFRCMREQPFFDMPQDTNNPLFWRKEQELVMTEIYAKLSSTKAICEQKVLDLTSLSTKPYFLEAVWIAWKLGLESSCPFNNTLISRLCINSLPPFNLGRMPMSL